MRILFILSLILSFIYGKECLEGNQFSTIRLKTSFSTNEYVGLPSPFTLTNTVVIVHNDQFRLINKGLYASNGIRQLILTGKTDTLMNEINNNHLNAKGEVVISNVRVLSPIGPEEELTFTIPTRPETPLISILAYIKDSPDWILAAVDQLLCSGRETIVSVYMWDAGVADGEKFGTVGKEVVLPVTLLSPTPFFYPRSKSNTFAAPLNVYVKNNEYSPCHGGDTQKYFFEFTGKWTNDRYIPYPSSAGFTNTILLTHDNHLNLFNDHSYLSKGMTELILYKNKKLVMQELDSPAVYQYSLNDTFVYSGTEYYKFEFMASKDHHFVTYFAQLNESPDWFIGSSYINLCNEDGWVKELKYESVIYDGGINEALTFGVSAIITNPQMTITRRQSLTNSLQNVDTSIEDLLPIANVTIIETENDDGVSLYSFMILLGIVCLLI